MMLVFKEGVRKLSDINRIYPYPEEGWTIIVYELDENSNCVMRYYEKYGWQPIKYGKR